VLQARPTKPASTRFLFIAPCVRGTLPWQGGLLPRHRRRIPSCHTAMPFASIGLGLGLDELQNKGYAGSSHPLEYVPCPAHNLRVYTDARKIAARL
jgi:hypothetical protein